MIKIKQVIARWRHKLALTPEQADQLAAIKFPCC